MLVRLTNLIKYILKVCGLNLSSVRDQCYDGAASMRGCCSRVQSTTIEENLLALHIHHHVHILNLYLVDLVKFKSLVRNTFGTLLTIHNLIGISSKRYAVFKNVQKESDNKQ